jgi:hypothetical protein
MRIDENTFKLLLQYYPQEKNMYAVNMQSSGLFNKPSIAKLKGNCLGGDLMGPPNSIVIAQFGQRGPGDTLQLAVAGHVDKDRVGLDKKGKSIIALFHDYYGEHDYVYVQGRGDERHQYTFILPIISYPTMDMVNGAINLLSNGYLIRREFSGCVKIRPQSGVLACGNFSNLPQGDHARVQWYLDNIIIAAGKEIMGFANEIKMPNLARVIFEIRDKLIRNTGM